MATPIGNLGDITHRALDILKSVARIAAEDTRVTAKLLAHYGIATPLIAVHAHNERRAAQTLVAVLAQGETVALVTDAGTPGISDPGAVVVAAVREAGYPVVPIPGPSALVCALSASGIAVTGHRFVGFLPAAKGTRRHALEGLRAETVTLAFYEAPHRIRAMLADVAAVLGAERRVTLARELTKRFEEIHACAAGDTAAWLDADAHREQGEYVVLVEGAPAGGDDTAAEGERVLALLLRELPVKAAVKLAAEITGAPRNALYAQALAQKNDQ
ncbi:MAG: 16S rRNA (cytidine(1402)-2'-O)-methyltransferase [Burkholderiales bacterium]